MPEETNHVLISGPSYSGKSTLVNYLSEHGKQVCDADKGLRILVDSSGKRILKMPEGKEWEENEKKPEKDRFRWVWPKDRLKHLLSKNSELYLFGIGPEVFNHEVMGLFDKLYYLDVSEETVRNRIEDERRNPKREHNWGRAEWHMDAILSTIKPLREQARKAGFTFLDGSLPTEKLFEIICVKAPEKKKLKM